MHIIEILNVSSIKKKTTTRNHFMIPLLYLVIFLLAKSFFFLKKQYIRINENENILSQIKKYCKKEGVRSLLTRLDCLFCVSITNLLSNLNSS